LKLLNHGGEVLGALGVLAVARTIMSYARIRN
jgi:hypothetical protein